MLVGGKIDASASELKVMNFVAPAAWRDDNKRVNISPKAAGDNRSKRKVTFH